MRPRENYIGNRYERLIAFADAPPKIRKDRGTTIRQMLCRCDCGNECTVSVPDLKSGNTLSCGCYGREAVAKANRTHGLSKSALEYRIWWGMIQRCEYEPHISYRLYGERGIRVCARWRESFEAFYADMGPRPSKNHSIDRINSDGNYEPGNCRWATGKEQFANTRVSPEFYAHMNRGA